MLLKPALALLFAALALSTPGREPYRERRQALVKALPEGVTVLFGRAEKDLDDLRSGFFQEPNFFYLTGWREPGAVLLLSPARELLFLPRRNPEQEKWTGRKAAPGDPGIQKKTGFDTVLAVESFERELSKELEQHTRLYGLAGRAAAAAALKSLAPLREISDAAPALARLRMKKSPGEIAAIERATDASIEAHRAAWKRLEPGIYEYQIAATMQQAYLERGCERSAYAPVVGSGPNAVTLHYSWNSRRIEPGELVLMDVGAECAGYTSDITRTAPAGGRFSERQRQLYQAVLGAQKAAIAAVRPGATLSKTAPNGLYKIALDYLESHSGLGKYFTHGLGHHVGLEVHDATDAALPLAEGMVITIEPGVYIPEEAIGIRIEDVVLVTSSGGKVLSAALPKEPAEIEKALSR